MTWVLVPAKNLSNAKSRLRDCLGEDERRQLAAGMLRHVLAVLNQSHAVSALWLITDSAEVAQLARQGGAEVLSDPRQSTNQLGAVIAHGLGQLRLRGASRVAVLMGDLPYLTGADVDTWLNALASHDAVLAADRIGCGTNGLAVSADAPIVSCFGHHDSLLRHQRSLSARGLRHHTVQLQGLSCDIDTAQDLERYAGETVSRARSVSFR